MDSDGGMRHRRMAVNNEMRKRASSVNKDREEYGWMSEIIGVVSDKPSKLRGMRVDLLLFEEAGSHPNLIKTYLQSTALVEILALKFGTRVLWGTGGDSGANLNGLATIFNNPSGYNILPYKHNHTKTGEYVLSGFFIPAYTFVAGKDYVDHRGVTNTAKAKEYYIKKREALLRNPKEYLIECAEFCFTPEDALALEGDNVFNAELLAEQLALIKIYHNSPKISVGRLEYSFKGNKHKEENIDRVIFKEDSSGKILILEMPILDSENNVPKNLYVAGIDGIDLGMEDTSVNTDSPSDFCVVVMRRAYGMKEPMPVCIYKDRPKTLKEAHMTCLKILQFYNCKAVLEATRVSLLGFFRERHIENQYLFRRPRITLTDIQRGMSKLFGAPATEAIIKHQLELISLYIDEFCHNIWFVDMLEEMTKYSYVNKTKFDIIAAFGMCLLGNEELMDVKPTDVEESSKILPVFGYYIDERGIKRRGIIPLKTDLKIEMGGFGNDYQGPRTSYNRFNS